MKKKFLYSVLFTLVFLVIVFAGERFDIRTNNLGTNQNAIEWLIKGTQADTSKIFNSENSTNIYHWAADSIGTDSVKIVLDYQNLGAYGWVSVAVDTVIADSTDVVWSITGKGKKARVIAKGLTDNRTLGDGVRLRLTFDAGN